MECPGPAVLRHAPEERSARTNEAAAWGTTAHTWMATGEVRAPEGWEKLNGLFAKKLRESGLDGEAGRAFRESWWPPGGRFEVAVAIDCAGGGVGWAELGGDDAAWKTAHPDSWVTGTLDYVGEVLGEPWIDDLKTGRWDPPPPGENVQLRLYALAALRMRDPRRPPPGRVVLSMTRWPRYPLTGRPTRLWAEITPGELADFERRLRLRWALVSRLRAGDQDRVVDELVTGSHCQFCDVGVNCPRVS
jgi:hypothetical protein